MSYRFMRMMIFFDLPTLTVRDKKEYRKFSKFLRHEGFVMTQESVYTKLLLNGTAANLLKQKVRNNQPEAGLVQMLVITEKQYSSIEYIVGQNQELIIDNDKRVIYL